MIILFIILFILLGIKGYVNYKYDVEQQRQAQIPSLPSENNPPKIEDLPDRHINIHVTPAYQRRQLAIIHEVNLKREYYIWKQNMQDYDSLRKRISTT